MSKPKGPADLPLPETEQGAVRRLGIELEFGGLTAADAAAIVAATLGGDISARDRHHSKVMGSRIGDITVELDTRWAKPDFLRAVGPDWRSLLPDTTPDEIRRELEALPDTAGPLIGDLLDFWLPIEVITPPMPHPHVAMLPGLCDALASAGATGTSRSVFGGFGLHLNPEVARRDAAYLTSVLSAYLLLSHWLRQQTGIPLIRQLGPFIDPFPDEYTALVTADDYAPDLETLIADYIAHNPTRNRELDMLPVFAFLREDQVRDALPDEKINARPTFHYRLPNCRLDEPDWSPITEWNRWVMVETLAADDGLRHEAAEAWRSARSLPAHVVAALSGREGA
jgi:hypothetical protein